MQAVQTSDTGRSGVTVVEAALVMGLLLVMALGVVEMGWLALAQATVAKAAQVGARFAVTGQGEDQGTRLAGIEERALATAAILEAGTLSVHVRSHAGLDASGAAREDDAGGPCDLVEVEVSYAYAPFTPLVGALLPDPLVVKGSQRMVNEPWRPCE